MIAALGTLVFLATLWLLVVVGAAVLEESGGRIAAALRGEPASHPSFRRSFVRVRARPQLRQPGLYHQQWRAAA